MRGRSDDVDRTICVVDADSVGRTDEGRRRPLIIGRILEAITVLQAQGFKIIIVSQEDLSKLRLETSVDESNFMYIKALNGSDIDTIRAAADFQCYFMTSADVAVSDWRLPQGKQMWLQQNPEMHVKFTFEPSGFLPTFPGSVAASHEEEQNLEREFLGPEDGKIELLPSGWICDSLTPGMAVLPCSAEVSSHPVLAIQGVDEKDSLLQQAVSLSQTHIYSGTEELELRDWKKIKGPWSHEHLSSHVVHATGCRNPLWAVGSGSRKQARRRAAHLALVVTYFVSKSAKSATWNVGPKDNRELNCLVARACKLIAHARSVSISSTESQHLLNQPGSSLVELSAESFSSNEQFSNATRWLGNSGGVQVQQKPAQSSSLTQLDGNLEQQRAARSSRLAQLHGNLKDRFVNAVETSYQQPGSGYLSLKPGDRVQLLYNFVEEGCIFGRLLGPTTSAQQQGWLPTHVVSLE
ncbi:unnamed protein product [Symbiodinium pilosum]|uniref:Uncharacterized protein n=1 Tax=Symbiodinium pilosum TaxID=2952 RepID=A0A812WVE1_SYMPI|nr:unnamed protein product [Symbiodinium pilosum]